MEDEMDGVAGGGWGAPEGQGGDAEWPVGVGWGPGGPPAAWQAPGEPLVKGDGDSGCGTDSEEDAEMEQDHRPDVAEARGAPGEERVPAGEACAVAPEEARAFAERVSLEEFERQRSEYTRRAVDELVRSPEYQRRTNSCQSCWSVWLDGQCRHDCLECGGFALRRVCPICSGRCGALWRRNVEMSHSHHEAHWDGRCGLPPEQRDAFALAALSGDAAADESVILDAMMDLNTRSASPS